MMKKTVLIIFLLFASSNYAETTGTINFTYVNPTTGLFGYTVFGCNTDADCFGYKCFRDYDGSSNGTALGWCNMSTGTNCMYSPDTTNIYALPTGGTICDFNGSSTANNTYRSCSNGNWSVLITCGSSQVCVPDDAPGSCAVPSASGSGSNSGGLGSGNFNTTVNPALTITSFPSDFEITQGASVSKSVVVKNIGNRTLNNVTISISGVSWYSLSPLIISQMIKDASGTFTISFNPPTDTSVNSYQITITASAAEVIAPSKTFTIKLNISEQNAQEQLLPDIDSYSLQLDSIEEQLEQLEGRGANISEAKGLYLNARTKLVDAKILAENKDYTTAAKLLDEAKALMAQASAKIIDLDEQTKFKMDPMWIVYGVVAILIIAFLRYLLLPPKSEKKRSLYELLAEQENTFMEKVKRRLKNENKSRKK